ncbi:MAG: O-antigen ligase family protein [Mangrovibacterium sp.]
MITPALSYRVVLTAMLVLLSGVFASALVVDNELHDPTRMGKIFFFCRWMLFVIPAGLIVFIRNRKQPLNKLSLFVLAWFTWIMLRGKVDGIWHDEKFFWFSGCFAFFLIAGTILSETLKNGRQALLYIPVMVIVLVVMAEAAIGLFQLYGGYPIYHSQFKVTGTFFNPAPYAGFLVSSLPWALLLSCVKQNSVLNKLVHWTGYLAVCLILVIVPATRSRAAWLGLMAVLLVWVFFRYKPLLYLKSLLKNKLKRRLAYLLTPTIFLLLFTGLYLLKKDSASGRLLIWKVVINTIKEQPIIGHGFNTVQTTMAPAQSAYFMEGNGSEEEKMLAGSVQWAFNEPLQVTSETGLTGLMLFLLITGYALFYKIPRPVSRERYLMIGTTRASLAGIMVFGCFSYPFYSLPVTILFFYSLAVLAALKSSTAKHQNRIIPIVMKTPVLVGIIFLGLFYLVQTPKLKQAYWLWDEAETLYQTGNYREANESFAEAYPDLKYQGLFLQQYGKSLYLEGKYKEAIEKLVKGGKYYKDEFWYITLGDCYKARGEYPKAEEQYKLAANMVPHKFYPLYLLAKLYHETGQNEKAIAIAREIIDKAVKVPSQAVEEIRAEMQEIITRNIGQKITTPPNKAKGENCTGGLTLIKQQFW